jgi:hypothetical protein
MEEQRRNLRQFFARYAVGVDTEDIQPPIYVIKQLVKEGWDPRATANKVSLNRALLTADYENWFARSDYAQRLAEAVGFADAQSPNWQLFSRWQHYHHHRQKCAALAQQAPYNIVEADIQASGQLNEALGQATRSLLDRSHTIQRMILTNEGYPANEHAAIIQRADTMQRPDADQKGKWRPVFAMISQVRRALLNTAAELANTAWPEWSWPLRAEQSVFAARQMQENLRLMGEGHVFARELGQNPEALARNPQEARIVRASMAPELFARPAQRGSLTPDNNPLQHYSPQSLADAALKPNKQRDFPRVFS